MTGLRSNAVPIGRGLTLRSRGVLGQIVEWSCGRPVVNGEAEWLLEGAPQALARAASNLVGFAEPLTDDLLLVRFGNAVGRFEILDGVSVEVVSGKWNSRHFDAMIADVTRVAAALPFAASSGGALPFERSLAAERDLLYHAFVYLRYVLLGDGPPESRLLSAFACVLGDPHQKWQRREDLVSPDLARRVDPRSLARVIEAGQPLVRVGPVPIPLATALRGHLPDRIMESRVESTYDTPENRFVKAFLHLARRIIEQVRDTMAETGEGPAVVSSSFSARLHSDCEEMGRAIDRVRHDGRWLWDLIGPLVHVPMSSTVLQRKRGYRDVLRHFVRLRAATRLPLSPRDARQLLEVKDIALMYELWTFFTLVERLEEMTGKSVQAIQVRPRAELEWQIRHGIVVRWRDGTRVAYNPSFGPGAVASARSYSVSLRPDIALWIPDGRGRGLHLLDAKFRLRRLDAIVADEEAVDENADTDDGARPGTFRRADLYKMHAYRDAIQEARSAWVLYPGSETCFFSVSGVASRREIRESGEALDGVGAIPLVPGSQLREVDRLLASVLD